LRKRNEKLVKVFLFLEMDVSESEEDIAIDPEVLALGRGIRITPGQRMEIVHLTKQRWSQRRIALRLG
jgi:hypothetical protein